MGTLNLSSTVAVTPDNYAGPAFYAYASVATSLSSSTYTKVLFQSESYDTNGNYDTSLSRFTPTVAGYYQLNYAVSVANNSFSGRLLVVIYRNGSLNFYSASNTGGHTQYGQAGAALVYANGSTDYFEIYAYQDSGSAKNADAAANPNSQVSTFFQGCLLRAA